MIFEKSGFPRPVYRPKYSPPLPVERGTILYTYPPDYRGIADYRNIATDRPEKRSPINPLDPDSGDRRDLDTLRRFSDRPE